MLKFLQATALASVACALVGACFPSFDSLTGNTATTDASTPFSFSDAAKEPDARGDAGPWCDEHATPGVFCFDFDTEKPTIFGTFTQNGGSVAIDDAQSASAPKALLATIPAKPPADGGYSTAYATYNSFPANVSVADVSFAVRIDEAGSTQPSRIVSLVFTNTSSSYEVLLNINANKTIELAEYDAKKGLYKSVYTAPALSVGVWTRLRIHIELASAPANASLYVEGQDDVKNLPIHSPMASGSFRTLFGLTYVPSPNDARAVRIDNLLISPK